METKPITKKEVLNPENIGQCECGNYAPYNYLRHDDNGAMSCPDCMYSFLTELVKAQHKVIYQIADPVLSKKDIRNMVRKAHVEATGVDMQDLIESGYFDEEES